MPPPTAEDGFKTVTITADIADADTKTSYDDADGKFSWTKGDQISVLASDNNFYTFTATETAATSAFTGVLPANVELGRFSYFPASENHTYDSDTWYSYFSIDEYRDMNGLASADIPMYGLKGDDDSFSFKHLTGAIQLTFTNIPANINEVEISVKSAYLKYSGLWRISTADWNWSAAGSEIDSELTYTRKVPVKNNTAQLYLPYKGQVWAASTINITGYDESENEIILLTDKELNGNSTPIERAQIVPYKTLELPDYVPPVDWAKIDWEGTEASSSVLPDWFIDSEDARVQLTELTCVADQYYLYARVKTSKSADIAQMRFCFADTNEGGTQSQWYWEKTSYNTLYKSDKATVTNHDFNLKYGETSVELETEITEDVLYWYMAFPRAANELTTETGAVNIGFISYDSNGAENGIIPKVFGEMLEVTLP